MHNTQYLKVKCHKQQEETEEKELEEEIKHPENAKKGTKLEENMMNQLIENIVEVVAVYYLPF